VSLDCRTREVLPHRPRPRALRPSVTPARPALTLSEREINRPEDGLAALEGPDGFLLVSSGLCRAGHRSTRHERLDHSTEIAPGMDAHFVVLEGDPATEIKGIREGPLHYSIGRLIYMSK
jgi:hypothetical protein